MSPGYCSVKKTYRVEQAKQLPWAGVNDTESH